MIHDDEYRKLSKSFHNKRTEQKNRIETDDSNTHLIGINTPVCDKF